jgi:hypothetical protein
MGVMEGVVDTIIALVIPTMVIPPRHIPTTTLATLPPAPKPVTIVTVTVGALVDLTVCLGALAMGVGHTMAATIKNIMDKDET